MVLDVMPQPVDSDVQRQRKRGDPDITLRLELALQLIGPLLPTPLGPAARTDINRRHTIGQAQRAAGHPLLRRGKWTA